MNHDYRSDFIYNRYNNVQNLPNDMDIRLTSNEKVYQDKTTYCRPVLSYYNEQFIYKTMERNARLKRLVKNLAVARQKEKESVSWNNFINELKNKHALKSDEVEHTTSVKEYGEYIIPENYNDYYKTRFTCVPSRPCKHFLQEFYGAYDESQSQYTYYRQLKENSVRQSQVNKYLPHDRDSYCYPTSSQGRLMMMDKERRNKQSLNNEPSNLSDKYLFVKSRVLHRTIDKAVNTEAYKNSPSYNRIFCHSRATSFDKIISVKADIKLYPHLINHNYDEATTSTMYDKEQKQSSAEEKDDEKLQGNPNNMKKLSLNKIDTKLETLIGSINKFIDEINTRKQKRIKTDDSKNIQFEYMNSASNINSEIYLIENTSFSKHKTKPKFDRPEQGTERKLNRCFLKHSQPFIINKKIQEDTEKTKSIKLTKGVQFSNKLKKKPRSVQITFEVPTKDCSTEVTRSLSNQNTCSDKDAIIEEICTPVYDYPHPHQRMTIAVNTDPLSFLGLLRISTDTFKRFLSYMPNIDCYSYLSLLQFPQSSRSIESHYVCNICGADFNKPSKLSDHIRGHNLGVTKDCCICRHVLDKARKSPGLFRCRYCGQPFVRAYCCELHQDTCARRFGLNHDVTSSLMLLR